MPRAQTEKKKVEECHGGNSWGCQHAPHTREAEVRCYRCKTYLGCDACVQIPQERLCLKCQDCGSLDAASYHGPIARKKKFDVNQVVLGLAQEMSE